MDSLPTGEGSSPANFTVIHNIHWDWSQSIRQQANDLPVICWVFAITGHTHATPGTILWAYPAPGEGLPYHLRDQGNGFRNTDGLIGTGRVGHGLDRNTVSGGDRDGGFCASAVYSDIPLLHIGSSMWYF